MGLQYKDGLEDSYEVSGVFYKTYVPKRPLTETQEMLNLSISENLVIVSSVPQ